MIPYAPSRQYEYNNSIADLIMRAGQQQAQGIRERGQISGGSIADLGRIAAGGVSDYFTKREADRAAQAAGEKADREKREKAEAERPRLEQEAELRGINIEKGRMDLDKGKKEEEKRAREEFAWREVLATGERPTPEKVFSIFGPERGAKVYEGLLSVEQVSRGNVDGASDLLKKQMEGIQALPPGARPAAYAQLRDLNIKAGAIKPGDAPETYNPDWMTQTLNYAKKQEKPEPGFSLSPGQVRFDASGNRIASVAPQKPVQSVGRPAPKVDATGLDKKPAADALPSDPETETAIASLPEFKALKDADSRNNASKAAILVNQARSYRDLVMSTLDDSGIIALGPKAQAINSAHAQLLLRGAGGLGQGALQAPDERQMARIFPNPVMDAQSIKDSLGRSVSILARGGKEGIKAALDEAVSRFENDLKRVYGITVPEVKKKSMDEDLDELAGIVKK